MPQNAAENEEQEAADDISRALLPLPGHLFRERGERSGGKVVTGEPREITHLADYQLMH